MPSMTTSPQEALNALAADPGPGVLGIVLSGSAGRGVATEWSDADAYVVHEDGDELPATSRTSAIDVVHLHLAELQDPPPFGSDGWWQRWSFAWAPVLLDTTGGLIARVCERQATLSDREQRELLPDRLDGYVNLVYRALKSDREGRPAQCRLDAAEAAPWLLDVVFTLNARVRPYNKYLEWELVEHPLPQPAWEASRLLEVVSGMLDGDAGALRAGFAAVERECLAFDTARGWTLASEVLADWGDDLQLLRGRR